MRRNGGAAGYDAPSARRSYQQGRRRGRRKPAPGTPLWEPVVMGLLRGWSPEQIAGRRREMHPGDPAPKGQPRDGLPGPVRAAARGAAPRTARRQGQCRVGVILPAHSVNYCRANFLGEPKIGTRFRRAKTAVRRMVPRWPANVCARAMGCAEERSASFARLPVDAPPSPTQLMPLRTGSRKAIDWARESSWLESTRFPGGLAVPTEAYHTDGLRRMPQPLGESTGAAAARRAGNTAGHCRIGHT